MPQMIFVNLPVADVEQSAAFYEALGATRDARFSQPGQCASMQLSDSIVFMLLSHEFFQGFTPKPIADSHATTGVLLCISRDSRDEVDAIVERARAAGGKVDVRPPQDMGFMYGRTFEDLDDHIFEPMWMDVAAFEVAQQSHAEAA